ncbi:MAG: short-chain dehydrogenase [Bacteroidetes bacterium HGW-Bacteroidetes-1]|jgi:3-oxoacyl-[acyl-carrier protein] reductase|nr:MAG: short-chain dehydrogenase [Bacteroidetes bacterium HGW-Bacteroidetes-1]
MDFKVKDKFFIVTGAGSGFGRAIAEVLLAEGAQVLAVARTKEVLVAFQKEHAGMLDIIAGDITQDNVQLEVIMHCKNNIPDGVVINAGGPPAKAFMETELADWDEAYRLLVRWKVAFVQRIIPLLRQQAYGRIVFVESVSVKQPVENLVLSNSLRLAVVGFAKSLAKDIASENITVNVIAPGYHATAAMDRLFKKKAETGNISVKEAKIVFVRDIPVKKMGEASELASLVLWLLSPHSRYATGQTFSHDGGLVQGVFG